MTYVNPKSAIPAFLKQTFATEAISPVTYNQLESFYKTQTARTCFFSSKGGAKSMVDQAIAQAKKTPGVGTYDIKNIEKGYKAITSGASRGWKWNQTKTID